ncbi:Protein MON2-like protein [Psilocybe cubensis]|uniref:Protein MON2-like protein n=2 Tax=Psilocybe cubensis TaxID=181762 RepID=A0ACB8GHH7_PSICU|nr:Protein MON2-like protein [Psilocybe cubensis]KAH9475059.1 Protein MON2-like protein [Psilocybe cubensis]
MSSLAFLVTELQSLASETRRKHPEIREAAEKSLAILRASPEQATANLASDGPQSDDLLRPVFMGCRTKNAKVVAISLGSLQRLIALKAVPQSAVPLIISTMSDAMSQGVDIQLRILQTLVSLVPNFPAIHGDLLGDALLLCFKLQESRIAVVSSTAAATLRQLVMFVVDKMVLEDRQEESEEIPSADLSEVQLPDGTTKLLGPSAKDAFSVFEDLCLLANSEKANFLKLEFLHKTFALELIESVLTNYHEQFRRHYELILLLSHHMCPLLLKSLSERPQFPLLLRCTRVVFLLLKKFSLELRTESEVFLMLLIRIISEENGPDSSEQPHHAHSSKPLWMRVLAMEIMRGLCSDAELIRNLWDRYDALDTGSKAVTSLVTALKRLVTEKPALLGVSQQMGGIGVQSESSSSATGAAAYGLDMAGRVASATVSGVVTMIGGEAGLSSYGSAMKVQCIDQLDKADAPAIPDAYLYLLAVQCIVSLSEGFASFSGPIYSQIALQRPRAAGDAVVRAPPALDLDALPQNDPQTHNLRTVQSIISQAWPALLAALSFIISTNLSDELFVEVLASYQAMTNVSGMLGLTTPRDAFFNSLSKFAVPPRVVSSLETWVEHPPPQTPRSATAALSEGLGLGGPSLPPGLSERNMACLKVFLGCALFLAGSLGESWYPVLEALQNADSVLGVMARSGGGQSSKKGLFGGVAAAASGPSSGGSGGGVPASRSVSLTMSNSQSNVSNAQAIRHPLLSDLEVETMQMAVQRLFDSSKNLEDSAFKDFVNALCKLSSEMVGMQTTEVVAVNVSETGEETGATGTTLTINKSQESFGNRRRVSGIYIPKNVRSGDFGISKLGGVAMLNIHRLIYRSPEIAWNATTSHLLMVIGLPFAPQSIRIQAARVLDEILLVIPRNLSSTGELQAEVQRRVLDVLAQQIIPDSNVPLNQQTTTSVEIRRMGLETLHQILQAAGHTLVVGWETIFEMLGSVCLPASQSFGSSGATRPTRSRSTDSVSILSGPPSPVIRTKPLPIGLSNPTEKSYNALVKIAFQSLTLVCDSVSSLSPEHLRLCISTLGHFGHQADTNIALTAAASLLWSVSDAIQSKRKNMDEEPEYSELWMFLLLEVLGLCTDSRAEVRDGAIQTLFRTMQLYGATLSMDTWEQCIWKVTFPLLDALTDQIRSHKGADQPDEGVEHSWDESKILALYSIGSIFSDFLIDKIILLDSYTKAWDAFMVHIEETILTDNRCISPPALRCLEKAIKAFSGAEGVIRVRVSESLERIWKTLVALSTAATKKYTSQVDLENSPNPPFTQEGLVAYVDVIQGTRKASKVVDGKEWDLPRLTTLMAILKGVLTYPHSPDYRPDIDALPPVQSVVMDTIVDIDLSIPGSPSLVMRDLSEYITLPFLAAFDVQPSSKTSSQQTPQKRITYIAISKKTMPMLVELFLRFKSHEDIYVDGTLESVLSAYSIPVKLKYDCPAPSKYGKDLPLWKTATTCFLRIVKESTLQIDAMGEKINDERIEGIWRQILDVFRGGILADCSTAENFSLDVQEAEENFDLALIASLEIDVVPHLGGPRVPDVLVAQLGKILLQGSKIYRVEDSEMSPMTSRPSSFSSVSSTADVPSLSMRRGSTSTDATSPAVSISPPLKVIKVDVDVNYPDLGTTDFGNLVPRERFSYWCFDLLFLICSDVTRDQEQSRRRLAALSLPSLLNRCKTTLLGYVADESLRGNTPFPRAREEELLYVLTKIHGLRLWPGSLWAALSDKPTEYCINQPDIPIPSTPQELIADSVKRTTVAHLFHFYPILCEIASIPRRSPSEIRIYRSLHTRADKMEVASGGGEALDLLGRDNNSVSDLDARTVARECLKEIGREMGVP